MKLRIVQHSFATGEVSPRIVGRSDKERYYNALETLENYRITHHGAAERFPGLRFVGEVKTSSAATRIIPFQFSKSQAYIVEAGGHYLRFIRSGAYITSVTGAELITNGGLASNTTGWTETGAGVGFDLFHEAHAGGRAALWSGDDFAAGYQDITTVAGTKYRLTFTIPAQSGAPIVTTAETTPCLVSVGAAPDEDSIIIGKYFSVGTHNIDFTATSTSTRIYFKVVRTFVDGVLERQGTRFDEVSVKATSGTPYEINSPYSELDLSTLNVWVQSADTLYLFHPNVAPQKLVRRKDDDWTISEVNFNPPATEEPKIFLNTTLTLSAVSGTAITVTAGAAVFLAGDSGRTITGEDGGRLSITSFTSTTVVVGDVLDTFPSTAIAAGKWALRGSPNATMTPGGALGPINIIQQLTITSPAGGGFRAADVGHFIHVNGGIFKIKSLTNALNVQAQMIRLVDAVDAAQGGTWTIEAPAWTLENGFPRAATLHQGRLWVAGTKTKPQTIWASASDSFEDFGRGTKDNESMEFTITAPLIDAIEWLMPNEKLFIGTASGTHHIAGATSDAIITPTKVTVENQSSFGTAGATPIRAGSALLYIGLGGNRLYELVFNLDSSDSFSSNDISLLSDHLGEISQFTRLSYEQRPWSIVYVLRNDGVICALTYNRLQQLIGWARRVTDGVIEDIATIPHWTAARDVTFVVVKRTIGGTKRYVEYFDPDLNMDSGLSRAATGSPVSTVSGLTHLNGETVDIVGDGGVQPQRVISGGAVAINPAADAIDVGLHYASLGKTLPVASLQQAFQGLVKRVSKITVRFYKSVNAWINGQQVPFRTTNDLMNTGIPVYTGEHEVSNYGLDKEGRITFEQRDPLPQTIVSIVESVEINDIQR